MYKYILRQLYLERITLKETCARRGEGDER